ncbi:kinase-like domain-containing protein [Cubamyces menziesii]|uniref:Aminoglycoside phosphotransferase domain-containing protein n=1 Tax=Trametes cubensis TaxID=1111947 RepID=A0AAD7TKK5_9APHY|nr:kinase-like domain-containing protein [Cubamyces menziesii]KAJ8463626.1 hypothetical protein ONZ51_g10133 [Trametes cubensis]
MPTHAETPKLPANLNLPSPASARELLPLKCITDHGDKRISEYSPDVLVKFGAHVEAEVRALKYLHGRLSFRTPQVLHHAPFPGKPLTPWEWRDGCWYFFMDKCPGVPLDTVIQKMSPAELDHIADQLLAVLKEMRAIKSTTIGALDGGPFDNRFMPYPWQPSKAFASVSQYLEYYRKLFLDICGPDYVKELFAPFPSGANVPVHLTHGDLVPRNILVQGSTITAIIDWETAGFYPEFWEYCRMHERSWMSPQWSRVLARVFPGPKREKEIDAVGRIIRLLRDNDSTYC